MFRGFEVRCGGRTKTPSNENLIRVTSFLSEKDGKALLKEQLLGQEQKIK